jgi:UDP-N-acetylmuramoylalanine--D-glutamate ligase
MKFSLPEFENKDIIFIGQDREWASFEKFIPQHAQIRSLKSIFITDENKAFYDEQLKALNPETTVVVKTAGFPGSKVPVTYTTPTKIFFDCARQMGAKIIGVTGTKGKSTTASLIYRMLQQGGKQSILGGNIGIPMLDTLEEADAHSIFVLELSSYQLTELDQSPDLAVITNLYKDHIDYHGNLESYWEAKRNIVRFMNAENTVIFNPDTEIVYHWLAELEAKKVLIDLQESVDMSKSQLIGEHNKYNYLMAKAAAQAFGVDLFSCQHILKNFKPISHRLEKVRTVHGITYIDDAIASQPEAAVAGITACVHEVGPVGCVFLGGQDRDYDFTELVKLLSTLAIPKLVLFPDTGSKIKALFPESYQPETFMTSDMNEAVRWADKNCPSGSVCLLSTASPSYSVWKDFEEKGGLFQKAVIELSEFN